MAHNEREGCLRNRAARETHHHPGSRGPLWPLRITDSRHWDILKVIRGTAQQPETGPRDFPKKYLDTENNNSFLRFSALQEKQPFFYFEGFLSKHRKAK